MSPGEFWAPTWSQRWGQNSPQGGYFRFGAKICYLLLGGSFQPRPRSVGVGSEVHVMGNGVRRRKETDSMMV